MNFKDNLNNSNNFFINNKKNKKNYCIRALAIRETSNTTSIRASALLNIKNNLDNCYNSFQSCYRCPSCLLVLKAGLPCISKLF